MGNDPATRSSGRPGDAQTPASRSTHAGVSIGSIVQIDPAHDSRWGGCLLIVTDLHAWGVTGYVRIPRRGDAYLRVPFRGVALVGTSVPAWSQSVCVPDDPGAPDGL